MSWVRKLAGLATGWLRAEFGWVVLLAAGIALMGVYVLYQRLEADRDALLNFAQVTCARSGQTFDATVDQARAANGKPVLVRHARGMLCAARVAALADFERNAAIASASTLATAKTQHDDKLETDRTAARSNDTRAAAAAAELEKKNATVKTDDRVDGDWFARLNDLAGMHQDR